LRNIIEECPSVRSTLQEYHSGVPFRSTLQEYPSGVPFRSTLQEYPSGVPFKSTIRKYPSGVPSGAHLQVVAQKCDENLKCTDYERNFFFLGKKN
jgi:hypothetical protein